MTVQSKILAGLLALFFFSTTSFVMAQTREELNARCWKLYDQAKYQDGLQITQQLLEDAPARDLVTAETHHVMGELLFGLARYNDAIEAYKEALKIRKKKLPAEDPLLGLTLVDLGLPYMKLGDFEQARAYYEEALALAEKHYPVHFATARIHNNLGTLLELEGFLGSAELHYEKALDIKDKIGVNPASLATTLSNLGELNRRRERLDKASDYFSQALEIRKKELGEEHPDTILGHQNVAVIQLSLGQHERARGILETCLENALKVLGEDHSRTATILGNLSVVHSELYHESKDNEQLQKATAYRERELGIRQRIQPKSTKTSDSLLELAMLRQAAGRHKEAVELMRGSMQARKGLTKINLLARLSYEMAASLEAEENYDEALKHSRNCLTLYHKTIGFKSRSALQSLAQYGRIQLKRGETVKADRATREFLKYYEENLAQVFSFTSERQRLGYVSKLRVFDVSAQYGTPHLMARTVLRHKGLVLDSLLEDVDLARLDPESAKVAIRHQEIGEQLIRLEMNGENSPRVEALREQLDELESQLARPFAEQTRRALKVTPEAVQAKLSEGTMLVEYVRYSDQYGAVIMSKEFIEWKPLGSAAEIDDALTGARKSLRRMELRVGKHLRGLYNLVWAPLEPTLGDTKHVIISPDGALNFLSFATLLTPEDKFLVESVTLEYVASGRDLLRPQGAHSREARLLGDIDFGDAKKSQSSDYYKISLTPLPGTAEECQRLGRLLESVEWTQSFSKGEGATEELVRDLRAPGILHLATHGFFLPKRGKGVDNPMLRSGLALAGAADSIARRGEGDAPNPENDGLLTAEEVAQLNLDDTWLVCLSSCETGLGEVVDGEGVLGLRRGFLQSGAQNLLLTLWPIDDDETANFMSDFYKTCLASDSPGQALSEVQRDWLVRMRRKDGLPRAVFVAGPFILSAQAELSRQ